MRRKPRTPLGNDAAPIRELSIDMEGSGRVDLDSPPERSRPPRWGVVIAIVAASLGLGYGFLLGRGDRPASPSTTTLTAATARPVTPAPPRGPFVETLVPFIRRARTDDLGAGVTEYRNRGHFEALAVDADGIVWAGGTNGVARLDPTTGEFTSLTAGPREVTAVAVAPDGSVWAASTDGLSRWLGSEWSHDSRFPPSYPSDRWVIELEVGADGDLWLSTYSFEGWTVTGHLHRLEDPYVGDMWSATIDGDISAIQVDADGALWVLSGFRLSRFDGAWQEIPSAMPAWLHTMAIDAADRVWIGGENHLAHWSGQEFTELTWETDSAPSRDTDSVWVESWVQALARGVGDDMWALVVTTDMTIGDPTIELIQFESGTYTNHPVPGGVAPGLMHGLVVAPDGAVWTTTGTQLLRFDGDWQAFTVEAGSPFRSINTIAAGQADTLWIADEGGLLSRRGDDWRRYTFTDLGLDPLDSDQDDNTWVATGPDGSTYGGVGCHAFQMIAGTWIQLPAPTDDPNACFDMTASVGPDGSLWLRPACCRTRSAAYRWSTGEWQQVAGDREFLDIAFTATGEMWLADESGVKRSVGDGWEPVLTGIKATEIAISGDGVIWATEETSFENTNLWRYDGATWALNQSATQIHSLTEGPDGVVWALRRRANGQIDLVDLESEDVRHIGGSPDMGDMAVMADGTVWIGDLDRLYRVDPLE